MPRRTKSGELTPNEQLDSLQGTSDAAQVIESLMQAAMAGDIVMDIEPSTVTSDPTSDAWTRDVVITIETAAGDTHTWLTADYASTLSIADDSTSGTASIDNTTLSLANGTATVTVSGDAQDWENGDTDTLTVDDITIMGYTVTGGDSVETFTA